MLVTAGWLPSWALAWWQVRHRRLRCLLFSDLLAAGALVLLACTTYVPLFFFNVAWFLPLALLPRGLLTELLARRLLALRCCEVAGVSQPPGKGSYSEARTRNRPEMCE